MLRSLGRYEEALASAEQAASCLTAAGVTDAVAWWSLWLSKGELLWALGRLEDGARPFRRGPGPDDFIDIGWSREAGVLSLLERYGEAADCYRRLVQLSPNDPDDWARLGEALRKAGRTGEAIPAFDRAISLEPEASRHGRTEDWRWRRTAVPRRWSSPVHPYGTRRTSSDITTRACCSPSTRRGPRQGSAMRSTELAQPSSRTLTRGPEPGLRRPQRHPMDALALRRGTTGTWHSEWPRPSRRRTSPDLAEHRHRSSRKCAINVR